MNTKFKNLQREMRKNMPMPEVILWQKIRNKQLGVKFRRQYTISNKIFDFYSPEIRLGIEIDGHSHFINDIHRQKEIEKDKLLSKRYSIKVLRFLNTEVMKNLEGVIITISEEINPHLNPPPSKRGEEAGGGKRINSSNQICHPAQILRGMPRRRAFS